jgi:outer membrane immunogenic protein
MGLAASAALALSISAATADGMPSRGYSGPVDTWSGIYVGLNGGWGWTDSTWNNSDTFFGAFRFDPRADGLMYGTHVGVQGQWGVLVAGVELSYDGSSMSDTVTGPNPVFVRDQFRTDVNDLLLAVGRLGIASYGGLFYVKGGYANADVSVRADSGIPTPGTVFRVSERMDGWTLGGGMEWKLSRNIIFGLEYNFVDLEGHSFHTRTTGTDPGVPINVRLDDTQISNVMARVSYKFDDRREPAPLK